VKELQCLQNSHKPNLTRALNIVTFYVVPFNLTMEGNALIFERRSLNWNGGCRM